MPSILVEGGNPLIGTVSISGSRNSVLKLIPAAMYSNEDVVLENVPRSQTIIDEVEIIKSIGGVAEWTGNNRLTLNGAHLSSFEIPLEIGSKFRTALLLAGPLLFRFGKAYIPKYKNAFYTPSPINRLIETLKSLGILVEEDEDFLKLSIQELTPANINFKTATHMGTDLAIISSAFILGETIVNNASEESEIDDLMELMIEMGIKIERTEPRVIKVTGTNIFRGAQIEVQPDKIEAATFATAAVITRGNVVLKNIRKNVMIPYVNFLNKIGARFEFEQNSLKVWTNESILQPANITVSPTPGYVSDWQPLAVIMLSQASGQSLVHDTVYINRFDYVRDLNRMGAKIDLIKPSEAGLVPIVSDDSYDMSTLGEPLTVAKINGPLKLKAERFYINDFRFGAVLVLAGLIAEGRSEIGGIENVELFLENFTDKLLNLGAKIWKQWE